MKRPQQHETDSAGQRLVREVLEPLGWVVRGLVEHDYGADFEVEVFERPSPGAPLQSTGLTFKVQLKSSSASEYSADGSFVSEPIRAANLRYLSSELNTPTILMHADVSAKRLYWHAPQLDRGLIATIATRDDASTVSVRIPTANALPATVDALFSALAKSAAVLAARALSAASERDFYNAFAGVDNFALITALRQKADLLTLAEADRLRLNDQLAEAVALIEKLRRDPDATIETKVSAERIAEPAETYLRKRAGAPDHEIQAVAHESALRLCALTQGGPPHLRLYAITLRTIAEFGSLLYEDWGLFLNWRIHADGGDALWRARIQIQRAKLATRLSQKYRQCVRIVNLGLRSKHRWVLSEAIGRLSHAVSKFAMQTRAQGYEDAARDLDRHAFDICKVAARVALEVRDEHAVLSAAMAVLLISSAPDSESYLWAVETMKAVTDPALHEIFATAVDRDRRRRAGEVFPDDFRATPEQIYQIMASSLGIDLSDQTDPVAQLVRIGIADLNPERVLRDCEHLAVQIESAGILPDTLRLPTAGSKLFRCMRHGYLARAISLDAGHAGFKKHFCDKCADRSPRPASWVWEPEDGDDK